MSPTPPNKAIVMKLHKLTFLLDKLSAIQLQKKADLSFPQFLMLMAIRRRPNLSQREIAEFHGVTEAAVSRQIELLMKRQFVARHQDRDNRRRHVLSLTSAGERKLDRANVMLDRTFDQLFDTLGEKGKETFIATLQRVLETLRRNPVYAACWPFQPDGGKTRK